MEAPTEFYSGIIQLLSLKFVIQNTKIRPPADIEPKIFKIYSLKFLNPILWPPSVNLEWLQILKSF